MAHWDESKSGLEEGEIAVLATETLAYFLADEGKREQLLEIFMMLERNIEQNVTEPSRRKVYGRTLYGVRTSIQIEDWVNRHILEIVGCASQEELLATLWPIVADNVTNNTFRRCDSPEVLRNIALEWIRGKSFEGLFEMMKESDVRIIAGTQRRRPKLEHIVDICENGLAYYGTLALGAITEIIEQVRPQDNGEIVTKLLELQKRLKYGLPDSLSVVIYELGFADRVVSMELGTILQNVQLDRKSIIRAMKREKKSIRDLLDKYPLYFIERLDDLL